MTYDHLCKVFDLPHNFEPPKQLAHEDLVARPLSRADLKEDLVAVNTSIEVIQKTRGGAWPQEALTEDLDFLDLAWHEREFRDKSSFAYVVYDTNDRYIGCFYLYPMGHRIQLTEATLSYDCDASWWGTKDAYIEGYYPKLYAVLEQWLTQSFPFRKIYYSNKEISQ